jgi:EF hand
MTRDALMRMTVLTGVIAAAAASGAAAQTHLPTEVHPSVALAQVTTDQKQGQGDMMRSGVMGGMPELGRRGHMIKVMFAIADTDSDGALSFEEVTAIHKRIFGTVDANKDGKVTIEEVQTFMRE